MRKNSRLRVELDRVCGGDPPDDEAPLCTAFAIGFFKAAFVTPQIALFELSFKDRGLVSVGERLMPCKSSCASTFFGGKIMRL